MLVMNVGRKARIDHLCFAPDGQSLAAACDAGAYLWRAIADGAPPAPLPSATDFNRVRFTHDGRWLFATTWGQLWRFDPDTGVGAAVELWGGYYTRMDPSPVGSLVLISQHSFGGGTTRCRVALWRADDLTSTGKVWEREVPPSYAHGPKFLPGGDRFVRIEGGWVAARHRAEYHAVTHDVATGELVRRSDAMTSSGEESLLSPDGRWLARRDTNRLDLWPLDPAAGAAARVRNDNRKHFTSAAFHPSGRYLAATSNDQTVKLYDANTWQEVRAFTWDIGRMRSIAFSPDGTLAAAGSDKGQVVIWDVDL
jgi:WD40 repeat protein